MEEQWRDCKKGNKVRQKMSWKLYLLLLLCDGCEEIVILYRCTHSFLRGIDNTCVSSQMLEVCLCLTKGKTSPLRLIRRSCKWVRMELYPLCGRISLLLHLHHQQLLSHPLSPEPPNMQISPLDFTLERVECWSVLPSDIPHPRILLCQCMAWVWV